MSLLTTHTSSKTRVLELLFPNGTWRELLGAIAWELADRMFENGETFTFQKWFLSITVPRWVFEGFLAALFGPRPGA